MKKQSPASKKKKSEIRQQLQDLYPDIELLFADGFDDAIIGVMEGFSHETAVAYDRKKCIQILSKDMTVDEAVEYFDYNVIGAYISLHTPVFITIL